MKATFFSIKSFTFYANWEIHQMKKAKTYWKKSVELGEPHADIAQQKLDSVQ